MAPSSYYDDEPPRSRRPQRNDRNYSPSPSPDSRSSRRPTKSILRDPSEPRKDKHTRSNSQVRIRAPSADSDDGWWVTHKDGRREFITDDDPRADGLRKRSGISTPTTTGGSSRRGKSPHDLENKTAPRNKQFRERRDGYESEEGESLKGSKPRSDPKKSSRYADDDRAAAAGTAGGALAGGSSSRRKKDDYEEEAPRRRGGGGDRERDDDRKQRSRRYDDDDDDDYVHVRKPEKARGYDGERGYESDKPRSRRDGDKDRDRDGYDDRRSGKDRLVKDMPRERERQDKGYSLPERSKPRPRYEDDYDDRRPQRSNSARYPDRRESDRYGDRDDRDRYRDSGRDSGRNSYGGRDRDGRDKLSKKKESDWKKEAGALFMAQAMPHIKREGPKLLKALMDKRGGAL